MKKKILVTYQIPRKGLRELEKIYELTYPQNTCFSKQELLELIPGHHGLLSIFNQPVDKELINAGSSLEIISNYGVGYNNIDIEAATKNGITVCNTPESVCEPTAELCFGLMLSLARGISKCDNGLRQDPNFEWGVMKNLGNTLYGKTLGIVGMGKIGRAVARRALAFGMKIVYHNRHPRKLGEKQVYQAHYLELDELLTKSDIVSLHCPLTPQTHHLIGTKEFDKMKNSAILINTARGSVVNEQALVNALESKNIAGAALDVYEEEPHIHPKLLTLENALLVPHIGTATIETRIAMAKEASQNFIAFWETKSPINRVNETPTTTPS